MFPQLKKLVLTFFTVAFIVGGIFGDRRVALAVVVNDQATGLYSDDFADATGVAASADAGVDVSDGTVKLKNAGGTYAAPYLASGTVTLSLIRPTELAKWGTVSIVADTPEGTAIKVQITDDAGNLFKDRYLPNNSTGISSFPVDIGAVPTIQCADQYFPGDPGTSFNTCTRAGAVYIKFILTSSNSDLTPSINSMQFTYAVTQGDLSVSPLSTEAWPVNYRGNAQATAHSEYANSSVYPAFRWMNAGVDGDFSQGPFFVLDDKIISATYGPAGYLVANDKSSGAELWRTPFSIGTGCNGSISANHTLYCSEFNDDRFHAVDLNTGTVKWSYYFGGGHGNNNALVGSDGIIYTVRNDVGSVNTVYAFRPDGSIKWTKTITDDFGTAVSYPSAISMDGNGNLFFGLTVYNNTWQFIQTDLGKIYSLNSSDGSIRWSYPSGDMGENNLVIDEEGTVYTGKYFFSGETFPIKIMAIRNDGTLKWEKNLEPATIGVFSLSLAGNGRIYAQFANEWNNVDVLVLNTDDGSTLQVDQNDPGAQDNSYLWSDRNGGFYYHDTVADRQMRYKYYDSGNNLRWLITAPKFRTPAWNEAQTELIYYGYNSLVMDERSWLYGSFSKITYRGGVFIPSEQYIKNFALAPWTLTLSAAPASVFRNNTITFSVTTSMQQTNPLTNEANQIQVVLDDNAKIPLAYSSTNNDGDTVWTGNYIVPPDAAVGVHNYTVQANAALIKTDIVTAFASPATGTDNTGLITASTYTIARSGTTPDSSGTSSSAVSPSISVRTPAAGATYDADDTIGLEWSSTNGAFTKYKVSYSTNDGTTWTSISDNVTSNALSWIVPNGGTTKEKIKVEGYDATGTLLATGTSGNFTVTGEILPEPSEPAEPTPPPTVDPTVYGTYDAGTAKANNPDFNTDMNLPTAPPFTAWCISGSLIKTESSPSVYYCGNDGKRYVFVNDKAYFSWYADFSTVQIINEQTMAEIAIGGNITYRPGSRMVKIQTDPKVYAVARGGILRWVTTEAVAVRLFGANWNTMIDDVPDSFFVNYAVGEPIME